MSNTITVPALRICDEGPAADDVDPTRGVQVVEAIVTFLVYVAVQDNAKPASASLLVASVSAIVLFPAAAWCQK